MASDLRENPGSIRTAPDPSLPTPAARYRAERNQAAEVSAVADVMSDIDGEMSPDRADAIEIPIRPWLRVRRSGVYRLANPFLLPFAPEGSPAPANGHATDDPSRAADTETEPDADPEADAGQTGAAIGPLFPKFGTEELRVDVDGTMATMTVSGTITRLFGGRLTWIARVTKDPATGAWKGPISYRDGTASLRPHANVSVELAGGFHPLLLRTAKATFSGGAGTQPVTLRYTYANAAFRDVAFEYDTVSDATSVTAHNPTSHPNHNPAVPNTTLTLESAYARVGIQVTKTGGDSPIDIGAAGPDATWSDQEMHDAMEAHWSLWADAPQWAVWVLFARLHDMGSTLGGIMFDDIGTAQRQGTAIFSGSFISQVPVNEANPGPWVERMRFWTAVHEIGHAFNLAHSWQKSLGTAWVPLADEPTALSYMNYPFRFPAGLDAFFAAFPYGFSPDELLFLRHAPERLVKMGAEPWFSNHGFEQASFDELRAAITGPLELEIRVHREPRLEFLEPLVAELRLRNVSSSATVVDANALHDDGLAIVVSRDGGETKRWLPFARHCMAPEPAVLQPGEAMYGSVFLSAGTGGWLITDPGTYTVSAAIDPGDGPGALSRPLEVVVDRPVDPEAERLAGDYFTREVAHALAFGGSRVLRGANDTLQEITERLPDSKVAVHASAVRGAPMASDGKILTMTPGGQEEVTVVLADTGEARRLLEDALGDQDRAADSLGHIEMAAQTRLLAGVLAAEGDTVGRADLLNTSADTLAQRGVLPGVVEALRNV